MKRYDAIIIGCGPAGLSAAFHLSKAGMRAVAVDRLDGERYARYHEVCGAGISYAALREAGIDADHILDEVSHTSIEWSEGKSLMLRTKGCILDRPSFLKGLRARCEAQGTTFMRGRAETVSDGCVTLSDGSVLEADYIIGSDGAFSTVRKQVFGTSPAKMLPASETLKAGCPPDHLRFSMIPGTGSYSWAFPHGGKVCEGSVGKGHGSGRYIPFGGVGEISRGNVLLLGDAAGMPNPVSFAGLRAALVSGRKAAEAIIENDVLAYAKWWNRSVLSDARFMEFHRRLTDMGEDEIAELFRPFSNGHVYISGLGCIICHPENRIMYFGCLQAFRHSW